MVIAVVALLVIGPEKLPKVARTAGALLGRLQRYVAQVKEEIGREARFEELLALQQAIKTNAEKIESSINKEAQQVAHSVTTAGETVAAQMPVTEAAQEIHAASKSQSQHAKTPRPKTAKKTRKKVVALKSSVADSTSS